MTAAADGEILSRVDPVPLRPHVKPLDVSCDLKGMGERCIRGVRVNSVVDHNPFWSAGQESDRSPRGSGGPLSGGMDVRLRGSRRANGILAFQPFREVLLLISRKILLVVNGESVPHNLGSVRP